VVVVVVVVVVEDIEVDRVELLAPELEPIVEDESADPEADFVTLLEVRVVELFEAKTEEDAVLFAAEAVEMGGLLEDIAEGGSNPEGEFAKDGKIPEGGLVEESTKLVDEKLPLFKEVPGSTG